MKPRFRSVRERWHRLAGSETVRIDGVRIDARAAVVGEAVRRQLLRADYEFAERRLAAAHLRPSDRVVEIGAGIGLVGLVCARLAARGAVFSFEANPGLEAVIRDNYARNAVAPMLDMRAVTPDGGPVTFHVTPSLLSSSIQNRDGGRSVTVESVAFGAVLREHRPDVIVMDVEGAEIDLLGGSDLPGVRLVVVETHANVTGRDAVDRMEAHMRASGFERAAGAHRNVVWRRG